MARGAIVLPAGSKLFHGTIEPFSGVLRPGGYDAVTWFADSPTIAQLYIPRSGWSIIVSVNSIERPDDDPTVQAIQRMIGLNYDYSDIEFDSRGRAKSYPIPKEAPWDRIGVNATSRLWKVMYPLQKKIEESKAGDKAIIEQMTEGSLEKDEARSLLKERYMQRLDWKAEYDKLDAEYSATERTYGPEVKRRILALGYETKYGDDAFEFHIEDGRILPPGGASEGRLFIGTTSRDMKLWLKAKGEGDLMNVQYHDVRGFRDARDEGLDGVMIDDFAQSEAHGNLGHLSVGLFADALKDVRFKQVPATYEEFARGGKTEAYPRGSAAYFHRLF